MIVNSDWSARLVRPQLPSSAKLTVVPLAYEPSETKPSKQANLPGDLSVLFLGQVCLRKGIHEVMAAARLLEDEAIYFNIVGQVYTAPGTNPGNVSFHGRVERCEASAWYHQADVFVLPTHSDGFALTQIEAMSHGLPVITTKHCGTVVENGVNGWIVSVGNSNELAECLRELVSDPKIVARASECAHRTAAAYRLNHLARNLACLE